MIFNKLKIKKDSYIHIHFEVYNSIIEKVQNEHWYVKSKNLKGIKKEVKEFVGSIHLREYDDYGRDFFYFKASHHTVKNIKVEKLKLTDKEYWELTSHGNR